MWCWRKMEKISRADLVKSKQVVRRVKEDRNILHIIKRRKANWFCYTLRRKCLLKHFIEGKLKGRIDVTGRQGRRIKQLLNEFKKTKGVLEIERGNNRSLCVENSLSKRLWTCRKIDYGQNE